MSFNRRNFLTTLGASIVGARTLTWPGDALGQTPVAKRLVVFAFPNGTRHDHWRPDGDGTSFTFPEGSMFEPLAPIARHLTIIDGVDFKETSNHYAGVRAMLCGKHHTSIDQHIAHRIDARTRFRSLSLGVQTLQGAPVRLQSDRPVPSNDSPVDVRRQLLSDISANPEVIGALRQSVIDVVRDELSELRNNLGRDERRKLDIHVESLHEVERSVLTAEPSACSGIPELPAFGGGGSSAFPIEGRAQMDIMVAALQCNMTRVASIQWAGAGSSLIYSWLGQSRGHHAMSHYQEDNVDGVRQWVAVHRWYAEQFRYLVERLAELPEPSGSGSMLDNTIVVWTTELGDSRTHECMNVPYVLAGGGAGVLSPGRCLRYDHEPHTKLLVSICRAMGVTDDVYDDPSYGVGPLEGVLA